MPSKLAQTHEQLKKAQARIAELESQLSGDSSRPHVLVASEDRYHRTLDNMLEGCQIIGFDWRYLYVNDTAARHGQRAKAELIGYTMMERYPGIEATEMFAALKRCMHERTTEHIENEFFYPDGTHAWFELSIQPVPEGLFILSLDITQRKQAEIALKRYAQRVKILHDIDVGIISATSIQSLVEAVLLRIRQLIPCQHVSVTLIDETTDEWVFFAADHNGPSGLEAGSRLAITPRLLKEFIAEPIKVIDDFLSIEYPDAVSARLISEGKRSALHARFTAQGRPLGSLNLLADEPGFFTGEHQEIAAGIGNQLAVAIHQAQLTEELARRALQLEQRNAELMQSESTEREQRVLAEALRDSLAVLTASLDVDTVMQQLLAYSTTVIPSEAGSIILFEGNQGRVAYSRGFPPEAEAYFKTLRIPTASNKYLGGEDNPRAYLAADTQSTVGWEKIAITDWIRSSIGVPIVLHGEVIGLLTADSAMPHRFQQKDVANLQTFARYAALALENAYHVNQLEQRVNERTAELQATKEQVEAILDNSPNGILLVYADLTVQQTNSSFNRLFCSEPDDYVGKSLDTLIHPEDVDGVKRLVQLAVAEPPGGRVEISAQRKDGTIFDAELGIARSAGGGLVCEIHDITERKVQERQLRFYASIQESVTDAVIATDLNFRIQSWNPAAERVYGWRAQEVIGKSSVEVLQTQFLSGQTREQASQTLKEQGFLTAEASQHHKDGRTIFTFGSVVVLKDEAQHPIGFVAVNRDITERKQAEEMQQQALAKERELSELKSRFVSMASHEFRTPLATILALTETLSAYRHRLPEEKIDERLDMIKEQVGHLKDIMEDVLLLARMQARRVEFNPAPMNVDSLGRSVLDEIQSRPDVTHHFAYACHPALQNVKLDKKLIRQVFDNLVSNAIKYSPTGTFVHIRLDYDQSTVVLEVRDEGIGIPESDLPHLFEPFHRAANVNTIPGTGLGLVIIKESVELHGGTISVDSRVNVGTTVTVRIPIVALEGNDDDPRPGD
ncbi:MAG: PAS domain S-box protein [Chloroflexi bacterium]|nr:PAS domain S-box protein [Chloroflexota bacterium]